MSSRILGFVTLSAALMLPAILQAANSYSDDFEDGAADGWTPEGDSWAVSNSGESSYYYEQADSAVTRFSYGGQTVWTDYSFEAKVKRVSTTGWGSCDLVGRRNGPDFYLLQLGSNMAALWRVLGDWERLQQVTTAHALNTWYAYKLEMVGDVITVYKDGTQIMSVTDPSPVLSGQIGFRCYNASGRFDDILVTNLGAPWPSGQAGGPQPSDGVTDMPRDVVLGWTPGDFAATHNVYLGTSFDDVNSAGPAPASGVWVREGLNTNWLDPSRLDFGRTYYWRVDEVNGPPDFAVYRGEVWSFTTEPVAYPIAAENVTATASSANNATEGPENTVNGSGLAAGDLHSADNAAMWLSSATGSQPTWIQYEFDHVYKLHEMCVWNYNSTVESVIGFGIKEATIEYSIDGTNWTAAGRTHEFGQGPGLADYAANTIVDLDGVAAKYVRITANSNWGGIVKQCGLSEVRFFTVPVLAREPSPASGATDVQVDTLLTWRAGREAAQHHVYLGTDPEVVVDGMAPVSMVAAPSCEPALDLDHTYYWQVVEVNEAETPSQWAGEVWSFTTAPYAVVDDFESYTDDMDAGQAIWQTWIDGFESTSNGSVVGNDPSPFAERTIVHSGRQSMPLAYDNTGAVMHSEATRTFDRPQDWGQHGIQGLTLWFYGDPANAAQQMYGKINNTRVPYDGAAADVQRPKWQMWYIDLTTLNIGNVTKLSLGFDRLGAVGGAGRVLVDDLRLYPRARAPVTPVDPGATGSQAQDRFEGDLNDSSGRGRRGSARGNLMFVAGQLGQAISLDGSDDFVNIDGYKGIVIDAAGGRFFNGQIDEVCLYDRVLSPGEVAYLAGRTMPFDTPF